MPTLRPLGLLQCSHVRSSSKHVLFRKRTAAKSGLHARDEEESRTKAQGDARTPAWRPTTKLNSSEGVVLHLK
eukprot:6177985-Pleurochrysis_carterae.AAC.6